MTTTNHFMFAGLDVITLAQQFQTPLYLYNKQRIEQAIRHVEDTIVQGSNDVKVFYAAKAFLPLAMAQIIGQSSFGIDVASKGECYTALRAGLSPDRILYHGNNKSKEELAYALEHGIGRIVIDSLRELEDLVAIVDEGHYVTNILIRFSPKLHQIRTHKNIQTGHKTSKFGVDLDRDLDHMMTLIQSHASIRFRGFHFHVGSQLTSNQHHIEAVEEIIPYMRQLVEQYGIVCDELDIGGGYGIAYTKDDLVVPIEQLVKPVMAHVKALCETFGLKVPRILLEPGRSIVGEAGVTLYTIGTIKQTATKTFVAVDGGMTDNLRVALYDARYRATLGNDIFAPATTTVTIVGNACESTDIMIRDIALPTVRTGDVLVVHNTGAYEHSLANNFNKVLRPAVVMVDQGLPLLIQRRETLDDLISRDLFLPKKP